MSRKSIQIVYFNGGGRNRSDSASPGWPVARNCAEITLVRSACWFPASGRADAASPRPPLYSPICMQTSHVIDFFKGA